MELPKGYASEAHLLSGGQQQRIAIARLFLKDPPIIFLDEPTANLDAIAAEQIKNSLDAIKKDRTVIIVSHSLSQIIDASHIVVLEKGRAVEDGTHDFLYDLKGSYFTIFNAMASSLNIKKIKARKTFTELIWTLVISFAVYFILPSASVELILIAAIPLSYITTHYFIFNRNRILSEIFFADLFLIVVVMQIWYVI